FSRFNPARMGPAAILHVDTSPTPVLGKETEVVASMARRKYPTEVARYSSRMVAELAE
ncbi:hypothetical protein MMC14_009367, partial [Varicellaria rhodocarpa]|nr:hypothetical protein [Varicellaria rhodocarpa]